VIVLASFGRVFVRDEGFEEGFEVGFVSATFGIVFRDLKRKEENVMCIGKNEKEDCKYLMKKVTEERQFMANAFESNARSAE
jgi:Na+/glutamate symporter